MARDTYLDRLTAATMTVSRHGHVPATTPAE
jgi:hypothetical protein